MTSDIGAKARKEGSCRAKAPQHGSCRGFAIIEIVVVMVIIGIIACIAIPPLTSWSSSLNASQSAKNMLDTLREARSRALTTSYQYEVSFDQANRQYRVLTGLSSSRQSYNTPESGWDTGHPVQDWVQLPAGLVLKSGGDCDSTNSVNIQFNANGTARLETPPGTSSASPVKICIQSGAGAKIHTIAVAPSGRITLD